mgnify:CR=1 FL=1
MDAKFSPRVKDVISYSREEALRLGHDYIGVEHLLLGIIREGEGVAMKMIKSSGIDSKDLRKKLESKLETGQLTEVKNSGNIPLLKQAEKVLKITYLEAKLFKSNMIGTEHLLLSILKEDNNIASSILNDFKVNYDSIKDELDIMEESGYKQDSLPEAKLPESADEDDEPKVVINTHHRLWISLNRRVIAGIVDNLQEKMDMILTSYLEESYAFEKQDREFA